MSIPRRRPLGSKWASCHSLRDRSTWPCAKAFQTRSASSIVSTTRKIASMVGDGTYNSALQVDGSRADIDGDGQPEMIPPERSPRISTSSEKLRVIHSRYRGGRYGGGWRTASCRCHDGFAHRTQRTRTCASSSVGNTTTRGKKCRRSCAENPNRTTSRAARRLVDRRLVSERPSVARSALGFGSVRAGEQRASPRSSR